MAIVTATNSTAPTTVKWASTDPDIYDRATQLAGLAENFDAHDHDSGKCLGVKRLQTTVAPTAAGHVRVNTDNLDWWGASAAAVQTAVRLAGAQTISGAKTFSSVLTVSTGGLVVAAGDVLVTAGNTYLGDTSNTFATGPALTINQGGADNEILTFKSSDVAHGMTSLTETDTYAGFGKVAASGGGAFLAGYSSTTTAVFLQANHTTDDTTKSNAALGQFLMAAWLKSGTTSVAPAATANLMAVRGGATTRFLLDNAGVLYSFGATTNDQIGNGLWLLNDTSNADMTSGLTINQGAATNDVLDLKGTGVAHGRTSIRETDTWFSIRPAAGASGGTLMYSITESGIITAYQVAGVAGTENTTKSALGRGCIEFDAAKADAGTSSTSLAANGNLVAIRDSGNTRFLFDVEGDSHEDGTGWTAYDDHDDLALLEAVDQSLDARLRAEVGDWLRDHKRQLEALRIVAFNEDTDGRPFVNRSRLQMLLVGNARQQGRRVAALEARLAETEALIAALRSA